MPADYFVQVGESVFQTQIHESEAVGSRRRRRHRRRRLFADRDQQPG